MKHLSTIWKTEAHFAGIALRATLGIVLLAHGCQLFLGWFGGFGFNATMQHLTEKEGLPSIVSFAVIALQFFGAIAILLGAATRFISFAILNMFIGMIITSHLDYGFFMNWFGNQQGEGFEYHILVIGMAAGLCLAGAGSYSVDRLLTIIIKPVKQRKLRFA